MRLRSLNKLININRYNEHALSDVLCQAPYKIFSITKNNLVKWEILSLSDQEEEHEK